MRYGIFCLAVVLAACMLPNVSSGQGVDLNDVRAYGTQVQVVGVPGIEVSSMLAQLPPDDFGKWHITIWTTANCASCEQLKRDFQTNPSLRALAQWAHFNVYSYARASQRFRFRNYSIRSIPTLTVTPPVRSPLYPYQYVERKTGYDGDPEGLAKDIITKIKAFVQKWRDRRVQPAPRPYTLPDISPVIPDLLPLFPNRVPSIPDVPNLNPGPLSGDYPDYPEAVVIIDPNGLGEKAKAKIAERLLERLKSKYDLDVKIRFLDFDDAKEAYPMVSRSDTPAVVITRGGRLVGFLSVGVLNALREGDALGGDSDVVPGGAVIGGGGILLLIIAALFGVGYFAKRRGNKGGVMHNARPSVILGRTIENVKAARAAAGIVEADAAQSVDEATVIAAEESAAVEAAGKVLAEGAK